METGKMKPIIIGSVALIALLILALFLSIGSVKKANKNLSDEKLRTEQLTAEKQQLTGELEKTKADLAALKSKNAENEKLLAETNSKLEAAEKRARALAGQAVALNNAKKEIEELKQAKSALEREAAALKSEYDKLLARSNEMQKANAQLEEEKKQLAAKLEQAMKYDFDNMMVTAVKGKKKEKLVVHAAKTKKIHIAFDVPKSLTEDISFKITTPGGQTVTAENRDLRWSFPAATGVVTASLSPVTGEFEESRQVNLTYSPSAPLVPGIYKIELICKGNILGQCRVKLR